MKIGNLEFKNNIFLSPMAGVTDLPFRLICKNLGAGFTYTEMISAKGIYYNNENTKLILSDVPGEWGRENCGKTESAVQLFGSDPDILRFAACFAEEAGAPLIDINMGCPAPKIVKNKEGCALMGNPGLAGRIIAAAVSGVKVPVTVKIRKGINNNSVNAPLIAKTAEAAGAAAVCVHGRTLDQFYSGRVDLNIIAEVKRSVSIPVIGNGDITSLETAKEMMEITGCDAVMIGRAAFGNPWVFSGEFPSPGEKRQTILLHASELVKHKGEYVGVREMRKHLCRYLKGEKNSAKLKTQVNKAEYLSEINEIIEDVY